MLKELKVIFTALMFYTRIPVPKSTGFSEVNLNRATRYFPLVGILVGGLGGLVFYGTHLWLPLHLSLLISLIFMILITGAFHEDAFADFCDGFGGGYTREQRLRIMKDSQIGTYGALALLLLILFKLFLLAEISPEHIPVVLLTAHALSRLNPVILIYTSHYISTDTSKSKPIGTRHSATTLIIAMILGIAPMALLPLMYVPFIVLTLALIFIFFRYYTRKRLGGYTGDVLGALQQLSEIGFLLSYIVIGKVL